VRHADRWASLLADVVRAVCVQGLKIVLEPTPLRHDALALGAHLPMSSAGVAMRLSVQMDMRVADRLLQTLGGGSAPEDADLLTEAVAECVNLLGGHLAGLVTGELAPLEMGTPCAGSVPPVDHQAVTLNYAGSSGCFRVRLEEIG